jgi:hypothetical protein
VAEVYGSFTKYCPQYFNSGTHPLVTGTQLGPTLM